MTTEAKADRKVTCPQCAGRGNRLLGVMDAAPGAAQEETECYRCEGWGFIRESELRGLEVRNEL